MIVCGSLSLIAINIVFIDPLIPICIVRISSPVIHIISCAFSLTIIILLTVDWLALFEGAPGILVFGSQVGLARAQGKGLGWF